MTEPPEDTRKTLRRVTKHVRKLLEQDLPDQRDAALAMLIRLVVLRMLRARGLAFEDLPAWALDLVGSSANSPAPDKVASALDTEDLAEAWGQDETLGWVYQFFNSGDERKTMRKASQAPRDSRELAVRNQFFTPRYVVQFLAENTLVRIWWEMCDGKTRLAETCEYLVRHPGESTHQPLPIYPRWKKDPRDFKILDPACGSGHFLLYTFDLLVTIYQEAWDDRDALHADYPDAHVFALAVPDLILRHNLYGVEIDARCTQIARLALWMRAQRAFHDAHLPRGDRPSVYATNLVTAEPIPGVSQTKLVGDLGLLLRLEEMEDVPEFHGNDLLRIARTRFDVVLMNPPFGACSKVAKKEFDHAYPRTKMNLAEAFVERGIQMLVPCGMLGALTPRTGFFLLSFQKWREEILLKEVHFLTMADLGSGVLDDAMVEVAAYTMMAKPAAASVVLMERTSDAITPQLDLFAAAGGGR